MLVVASKRVLVLACSLLVASSSTSTSEAFVVSVSVSVAKKPWSCRPLNLFGEARSPDEVSRSGNEVRRTMLEFKDLEPLEETEARRKRIERDLETRAQFETFGDPLWDLRSEMEALSQRLVDAIEEGEFHVEESTREKLRQVESRDPELAYMLALSQVQIADGEGRLRDAQEHRIRAAAARSCLPQFNLNGLWVGKYGSDYGLINITYVGDTLVAEKVTGENNVPCGAISFQVDLHPLRAGSADAQQLQPIVLTEKAAQKWGTRRLPRYAGHGQVAEPNFRNKQWLDGQLIIIGTDYFSFAWLPIEQQIFFGRPSPELALKMLRDSGVIIACAALPEEFSSPPPLDADVKVQKDYVTRCLELSHDHEDEIGDGNNAFGGIWYCNDEAEESYRYFE